MSQEPFLTRFVKEIKYALKPGVTPFLISLERFAIALLLCFSIIMIYINGSIHFYVLTFLSIGLFLAFEYSVIYIKKCPEFYNTPEKLRKMEDEEKEKELNKQKQD